MRKILFIGALIAVLGSTIGLPSIVMAQDEAGEVLQTEPVLDTQIDEPIEQVEAPRADEYYIGTVLEIVERTDIDPASGQEVPAMIAKVRVDTGSEKGQEIEIDYTTVFDPSVGRIFGAGERVILTKSFGLEEPIYYISDRYRLPAVYIVLTLFLALAVLFGRLRGLTSILGLFASVGILIWLVVPQIAAGRDPLLVSVAGGGLIAVVSLYVAHGFNRRTTVAVASTLITMGFSVIIAKTFVWLTRLTGVGTEEAVYLQSGPLAGLDLRGLLLAGMIIGALGVLDDITTAQAAAVDEIKKANPSLSFRQLYVHGESIGREHIASLVNTLALAYVGASFPLLLLFHIDNNIPFWVIANSEFIMEEVIRTLVGSSTLIVAVPIVTVMACWFLGTGEPSKGHGHSHHH